MLIVYTQKTPPNFDKFVAKHLFKIRTGLYIGDVSSRIKDWLIKTVTTSNIKGSVVIAWSNSKSHAGFELFEYSGDGSKTICDFDGLKLPKI